MAQAGEQPQRWALVGLLLLQLLSFALIASQHATIQQLRGEAAPASRGRRLLQAGQVRHTPSCGGSSFPLHAHYSSTRRASPEPIHTISPARCLLKQSFQQPVRP